MSTRKIGDFEYTEFKRDDLGNKKCIACGKGVGHDGIDFYRVRFERFMLDIRGIQKTAGLEMYFGGGQQGAVLAHFMGSDPNIALGLGEHEILACGPCSMGQSLHLAAISEQLNEADET